MTKNILPIIACLAFFLGCQKKDFDDPTHEKAILFFSVEGQIGKTEITRTIDTSRVRLTLRTGTDLSAVRPVITVSDGASVSPASGESVNFAAHNNAYTYVVTSANGQTRNWLVEVSLKENPYENLVLIQNTGGWDSRFQVYHDTLYNNYLTRYSGWNGGDGCVTTLLPNNDVLWSFQDSFFGEVTPERARIDNVFVRNAGFIEVGKSTSTYQQLNPIGSDGKAKTWVLVPGATDGDKDLYWGGPAQVLGNEVQMVMGHMRLNGSGVLEHHSTDVAIFTLPGMQQKKIIEGKWTGPLSFDASIFKSADGFTYMYATENYGICASHLYVARAANNDVTGDWEFYTKTGWKSTSAAGDLQSVLESNATQPNVFEKDGKYYLVSQASCYGQDINIWEAPSPIGPFTNQRTLYRIPDTYNGSEILTYNAVVHHALSRSGELVISYNINPHDFWSNFNKPGSADRYRPWVVRVFNWQ